MLKLYYHPLSPYSQKALIALHEKAIEFEPLLTNLFDPEVRARYQREVSPLCKIPFLVRPDGWVVPESSIIIEYLDTYFDSGERLIPDDRDQARQSRFYDRMGDLYLIDRGTPIFFESLKPEAARDQALIAKAREGARTALALFDKELKNREFLVGGRFTQADIAPGIAANQLTNLGFDLAEWPNVQRWSAGLWARPAWQKVGAEIGAAVAALMAARAPVSEG